MQPRRWLGWSIGFVAGIALCGGVLQRGTFPPLLLNLSASLPRGLYRVQTDVPLERGMVVVVAPSAELEAWIVERGYLPSGVPLLKPVAGLGGDTVCVGDAVRVNGQVVTTIVAHRDSEWRELPHWQGCTTLGMDEVFVLSTTNERSLDSRYIGPVPRATVQGTATLLWSW